MHFASREGAQGVLLELWRPPPQKKADLEGKMERVPQVNNLLKGSPGFSKMLLQSPGILPGLPLSFFRVTAYTDASNPLIPPPSCLAYIFLSFS